jgi:hypothetical protein
LPLRDRLLSDAVPFADVLRVKASLVDRIQDLLLSLPAEPRDSTVTFGVVKTRAKG